MPPLSAWRLPLPRQKSVMMDVAQLQHSIFGGLDRPVTKGSGEVIHEATLRYGELQTGQRCHGRSSVEAQTAPLRRDLKRGDAEGDVEMADLVDGGCVDVTAVRMATNVEVFERSRQLKDGVYKVNLDLIQGEVDFNFRGENFLELVISN
eukprot:Skav217668  [mRNA]  locus=scaffold2919:210456:213082:+ [translate_table: standard]